jgi:predicted Zn-dependent protease
LLIEVDAADLMIVSQAGSPKDQVRAIAHHLAHLLHGHQGTPDDRLPRAAFPHLASGLVSASLTACRYTPEDEKEADAYAARFVAHVIHSQGTQS